MKPGVRIAFVSAQASTLRAFYLPLLRALNAAGAEVIVVANGDADLDALERASLARVYAVPLLRRISPVLDARSLRRVVRLFRAERPDIVHSHMAKGGLVGMSAARLAGVRHRLHTLHGLPLETARGLTRHLLGSAERLTFRLAQRVCVVSESLRRRAVELRLCSADKTLVLGAGTACGLSLERFTPTADVRERGRRKRREFDIPVDSLVVGFVGRLVYDKGIHLLVKAFVELANRRNDLHLLLLGDHESYRGAVPADAVETIRRHPRIRHAPFDWDPVPYYAAMDVVVLPTYREGWGYTLLEAAAMGLPVVATRTTGCVDAVRDGETGLLVDVGDVAGLIRSLEQLLRDADLRQRLGRAGRQRVEAEFTDQRLVAEHLRLYEELSGLV
ncbi:MAG TPA: glycosyltransferase family 4 protein [Phycisphaerae bacterium]|nr:glycosyltransferase family 4 protein [Phycisphaerae bacterium]HNU46322.1 glycosyltransferase family 4 protein [Phycisphaerae bacterium]